MSGTYVAAAKLMLLNGFSCVRLSIKAHQMTAHKTHSPRFSRVRKSGVGCCVAEAHSAKDMGDYGELYVTYLLGLSGKGLVLGCGKREYGDFHVLSVA